MRGRHLGVDRTAPFLQPLLHGGGELGLLGPQVILLADVGFQVEDGLWKLDLVPRDRVVRQLIERLVVRGRGDRLVRMDSIETSGDVTTTEFLEVEIGVEFDADRRRRIFSIEPDASQASEDGRGR